MPRFVSFVFSLVAAVLLLAPLSTSALLDFGGWVLNVPSVGGVAAKAAVAAAKASGTTVIFPPCVNAVEEVNIKSPPEGLQSPPVLLQFVGNYTYTAGPAKLIGQKLLGKYLPTPMPCIAIFLLKIPCPPAVCIIPTPLPLFTAPFIIWNGSSIK